MLSQVPRRWRHFDFERLADVDPERLPDVYDLEALGAGYEIEVMTTRAADGAIIQVGTSTRTRVEVLRMTARTFLLVAGPLAVAIIALTAFNVSRITASIGDVTAGARHIIATGRYDRSIEVRSASRETEEMVATFNALLRRVNDLVTRLRTTLNSLAHDIRTPIARMRSRAELALSEETSQEHTKSALADTLEESRAVIELLQRFLDASEAESGTLNIHPERNELTALIEPVIEAYQFVAEEREISIRGPVPGPERRECRINVDGVRIRQAVSNLLDNAVKFSPHGGDIEVAITQDDRTVTISVEDRGPGIAEAQKDNMWEYQARGEQRGASEGYGLGLTIVRAVAEAHGGSVDAANRPDGGSRFVIRLPAT